MTRWIRSGVTEIEPGEVLALARLQFDPPFAVRGRTKFKAASINVNGPHPFAARKLGGLIDAIRSGETTAGHPEADGRRTLSFATPDYRRGRGLSIRVRMTMVDGDWRVDRID